jgi:N-acetylglutamate synthase-like GNAT family acetyltransferase
MTTDPLARRATVEDLPQLRELWRQANLPWQDLEKQFKDFQVVQAASGPLIATLGLRIAGHEGWLFCEAFGSSQNAESLRPLLWERVRIVAQNHGLVRLWTQDATPFWQMNGFTAAAGEQLAKRPESFRGSEQPWFFLQLRDEEALALNLDKEFAVFQEAQKEETARVFRQARIAKAIALVVGLALFAMVIFLVFRFQSAASHRSVPTQSP